MLRRLEERIVNKERISSREDLLTVHHHAHILDETVKNLERLCCRSPSLILRESAQPQQDRFHVLLSENFLDKFDCVAVSKVTR